MTTVRVRGSGGMEFDMDIPPEGSRRREIVDAQLAKGDLVVIDKPAAEPRKPVRK